MDLACAPLSVTGLRSSASSRHKLETEGNLKLSFSP
jgi:hypothetical protein